MSADRKQRYEGQLPKGLGPVDLAKAVLSWIGCAIASLVIVCPRVRRSHEAIASAF